MQRHSAKTYVIHGEGKTVVEISGEGARDNQVGTTGNEGEWMEYHNTNEAQKRLADNLPP